MNKDAGFSLNSRLKSFRFAVSGVLQFFRTEHNAWLHLFATIVMVLLCFFIRVSPTEIIFVTLAIALVWVTEMLNTCIEKIMDRISGEYDERIKLIKDISAGAVLVAAIAALVIGLVIFIPKFFHTN